MKSFRHTSVYHPSIKFHGYTIIFKFHHILFCFHLDSIFALCLYILNKSKKLGHVSFCVWASIYIFMSNSELSLKAPV